MEYDFQRSLRQYLSARFLRMSQIFFSFQVTLLPRCVLDIPKEVQSSAISSPSESLIPP